MNIQISGRLRGYLWPVRNFLRTTEMLRTQLFVCIAIFFNNVPREALYSAATQWLNEPFGEYHNAM
jgi:hypothetical protein